MRLEELKPRWIGAGDAATGSVRYGVTFLCPHCQVQRLGVMFHPPININQGLEQNVMWYHGLPEAGKVWHRQSGESFADLTLTPSINTQINFEGYWHGFITNGNIT